MTLVSRVTHVSGSDPSVDEEDEAGLEFHRGGALTFRGLESTGIIDRPMRLPFDERPCYSNASGTVTTKSAYDLVKRWNATDLTLPTRHKPREIHWRGFAVRHLS